MTLHLLAIAFITTAHLSRITCMLILYLYFRDVLPFTLELPDAIARASSRKQLESISHMGVGRYKLDYLLNDLHRFLLGIDSTCILCHIVLYNFLKKAIIY